MGAVQYLSPDHPEACMIGFVSLDEFVFAAGPQAYPADDNSFTYLGDGTISMNMIQEGASDTYLYKLTFRRNGSDISYKAWSSLYQEETAPGLEA